MAAPLPSSESAGAVQPLPLQARAPMFRSKNKGKAPADQGGSSSASQRPPRPGPQDWPIPGAYEATYQPGYPSAKATSLMKGPGVEGVPVGDNMGTSPHTAEWEGHVNSYLYDPHH
ncbi:hypothetical protein PspLS_10155 [Pyricularia sp. CBS 133598]|nr:hypothetical protein PspLS_10155 [Pyricularia sp. CBS 133598]